MKSENGEGVILHVSGVKGGGEGWVGDLQYSPCA